MWLSGEGVVARGGNGVSGEIGRDLETGMEEVQTQCFRRGIYNWFTRDEGV